MSAEQMPVDVERASVRERLVLALDLDDLDAAVGLAEDLSEYFGVVKVGLELFSAAGPSSVSVFVERGFRVFLDLKLHDIPTTVRRASALVGRLGASFLTVHTAGGKTMVEACVEGLSAGAVAAGLKAPVALGVTVLTSDVDADESMLRERTRIAKDGRCGGLVCAASDLEVVRAEAPGLVTVVPGTRPEGASHDDQGRVATPQEAIGRGANLLVIGRVVTASREPRVAAKDLYGSLC